MNTVAIKEPTGVALFIHPNPVAVLLEPDQFDKFYEDIRAEIAKHTPDTSTAKGRGAIASLAFKVAKTKTFLDETGKRLNEEARSQINKVDASRRAMREKLEALKDEVRRPLTEWEEAEEERQESVALRFNGLKAAGVVTAADTSASIAERIAWVEATEVDESLFQSDTSAYAVLRNETLAVLQSALQRAKQEEADRAELERLRAEKEERDRQERARVEAELAAAERAEREKAEAERKARAEAAEKARIEAAAEAARQEAAREAEAERLAAERAHEEELRRERAERERIEREHREAEERREAEARYAAAAQAKRDTDKKHRAKVMGDAKAAIMAAGDIADDPAKKIVLAIVAGEIPNTSIRF